MGFGTPLPLVAAPFCPRKTCALEKHETEFQSGSYNFQSPRLSVSFRCRETNGYLVGSQQHVKTWLLPEVSLQVGSLLLVTCVCHAGKTWSKSESGKRDR